MNTVGVIINASSGTADTEVKLNQLREAFSQHNLVPEFYLMHGALSVQEITQKALANNHSFIVAAGGDGTISAVASQVLNSDIPLGILPMGTFNHLAQDLGIPLNIVDAVAVLASGTSKKIDVAKVNDQVFLNNSSIGIYSKLVSFREDHQKFGWSKRTALLKAIASTFFKYSFLNVEIEIDGKQVLFRTPLVFIGNNRYEVEGFSIGKREQLDAGLLCVYIIKHTGRGDIVRLGMHALLKRLRAHEQFDEYFVKNVTFSTRKSFLKVAIDGEITTIPSPLKYSIHPKALTVICKQ